jgi:hypothetical protein
MSEQFWLRKHPTTNRWRLELRRILAGERESTLLRIGGAAAYVNRYIFDADDPVKAETAFRVALHELVHAWSPARTAENGYYFTNTLLELIIAFKPESGFTQILDHLLKRRGSLALKKWGKDEASRIDLLALTALQRYYPVAPRESERDPAFQQYVRLLSSLLEVTGKEGYALRHLLELGIEAPTNDLVANLVGRPRVVLQVVEYALSTERRDLMKNCAGMILGCCLRLDSMHNSSESPRTHYEEFCSSLRTCQAELVHGDVSPAVKLPDGSSIQLLLRPTDEHFYHEVREEESRKRGIATWEMIDETWDECADETV